MDTWGAHTRGSRSQGGGHQARWQDGRKEVTGTNAQHLKAPCTRDKALTRAGARELPGVEESTTSNLGEGAGLHKQHNTDQSKEDDRGQWKYEEGRVKAGANGQHQTAQHRSIKRR